MNITVYLASSTGNDPKFEAAVKELGTWIGASSNTLIYGGSKTGLMGELAQSVLQAGGKVIGVEPQFFIDEEYQYEGLTQLIVAKDMAERKQKMIELADAYVALPGGPGTLDEISEVICLARLGIENKACVLFDTDGYYQALKKIFEEMVEVGFSEKEDFKRVLVSADLDEIERFIEQ